MSFFAHAGYSVLTSIPFARFAAVSSLLSALISGARSRSAKVR